MKWFRKICIAQALSLIVAIRAGNIERAGFSRLIQISNDFSIWARFHIYGDGHVTAFRTYNVNFSGSLLMVVTGMIDVATRPESVAPHNAFTSAPNFHYILLTPNDKHNPRSAAKSG
jgi:hypothetical protein